MQNIERLPRNVHGSLRSGVVMFDLPRVVEELVNNSLDANPTKVSVFVNVRTCYIKIEDDGCGITRDELVILGEKYATSKSGLVDDGRSSTHGLGFRGEALLSLSNISIVEVRTKARGKPNAYCKIIKGSKCLFLGIDDQREGVGTTVIVRDLFYNQPVRRRYMQSSSKKVLYCVKKVVLRAAFVHSQVSFKLVDIDSEEELICTTPSSSPLPFVSNMFSKEVSDSLHEIVFSDDMLMLSGYISGPGDVCPTKALQYLYVNLRFISKGPIHNLLNNLASSVLCSLALHAVDPEIQGGKRHKIQANPAFILNLHCPTSLYDLHFEPSKTIIEFKDWDTVLTFFERAVRQSWQQHLAPSLQGSSQKIGALRKSEAQKEEAVCLLDNMLQPNPNASQPCSQPVPSEDFQPYMIEPSNEKPSTFDKRHYGQADAIDDVPEYSASGLAKWRLGIPQTKDEDILHKPVEQTNDILDISSGLLHISGDSLVPELINKDCLHNARVLYQLDKKFIPVMANGRLMIIDQHAADERIRVEELRRQVVSGEGRRVTYLESEQELVLPEMGFQLLQKYSEKIQNWGWIFNIHSASQNLFNKNLNLLRRHSSRVILVAVPCILGINLNDKDLLEFIQQLVETDGSSTLPPSVLRILNFKACRGAIMFGDSLLPSECSLIVEELKATSLCFQCAHGRPTTVPLLNMASLHEQLAKLKVDQEGSSETWHGLRVHRRPSIRRAQLLLDSAKRFHNG